jgi:hypothetical protein
MAQDRPVGRLLYSPAGPGYARRTSSHTRVNGWFPLRPDEAYTNDWRRPSANGRRRRLCFRGRRGGAGTDRTKLCDDRPRLGLLG